MNWKRKSSGSRCREEEQRERLIQQAAADPPDGLRSCKGCCVPRGCVAVLVGGGAEPEERVVVDVRALGQPCVRALLDMAARELGYDQKGVLRIPCAAAEFRRAVAADGHRCMR
ncbi:Auxin-responsive protein SAUR32 [Zea mays]|jgi:SAUR family protein|uniref:Auxin responsive protein n=2 Tax=Zea mays TaxID=4577 RepID=A0A1D6DZC6_MAIZE|nr:Auxin responsive protein [Zea mays]PWZ40867.1 Auxin-responsive protein SAUR32 [Zea mays]|eukprot:XP_008671092.1 auxin-responsive protein SAUR71 [Zea mays]